jgi:N-acetylneuraminic acid mutarotase
VTSPVPVLDGGETAAVRTDLAEGLWSSAGELPAAIRWYCQSEGPVLLADGRVLLAGGTDDHLRPTAAATIYDPVTNTWTATGSLNVGRNLHTVTTLPDGRVLVTGGIDATGATLGSAELYNPATGAWTMTGPLAVARSNHAAIVFTGGKVMVSGGEGARTLNSCEIYDPGTGTWHTTFAMTDRRSDHALVQLDDGYVLAVGGNIRTSQYEYAPIAFCDLFDPVHEWWFQTGSLRVPRRFHQATKLADGTVLATGGSEQTLLIDGRYNPLSVWAAERYNPVTRTWAVDSNMAYGRSYHRAVLLPSTKLLVIGGMEHANPNAGYRSTTVYDPNSGTWAPADGLAVGRWAFGATALADGRVLAIGGTERSGIATPTPGVDVLTPTAEVFTP